MRRGLRWPAMGPPSTLGDSLLKPHREGEPHTVIWEGQSHLCHETSHDSCEMGCT